MLIRSIGENHSGQLVSRATEKLADIPPAPSLHVLPHVLGSLLAVIIVGRGLGLCLAKVGQPRVIGEMLAGIVLGPSILGRISPDAMHVLVPVSILPLLGIISQLGIILYMFLVGLELNVGQLKAKAHASIAISHASILAPFLLGSGLAIWLHERLAPEGVPFTSFAMFMGVAMAITAFPVLARILADRGIDKTSLGAIAISCAAADDVTAWCLLAFVAGVSQSDLSGAIRTSILAFGYVAAVVLIARNFRGRFATLASNLSSTRLTVWILVTVLASTLITESIGIHAVFGAFLIGAIIPHDSFISKEFRTKLSDVVSILLLPAFFAVTGMRTEIGLLISPVDWLICFAIILVATIGKFGGTLVAARITGLDWKTSASLGALMNTRGLMELIVLNVGLELGVISPTLFTMMVIMALVTTLATTPALGLIAWISDSIDFRTKEVEHDLALPVSECQACKQHREKFQAIGLGVFVVSLFSCGTLWIVAIPIGLILLMISMVKCQDCRGQKRLDL
ncbi:MAG: cation:proton antiporter [Pirellulales bacterium]